MDGTGKDIATGKQASCLKQKKRQGKPEILIFFYGLKFGQTYQIERTNKDPIRSIGYILLIMYVLPC